MQDSDYGRIEICLDELLEKKGISKNKLSYKAEMTWKQIDKYCKNEVTRLDTHVLSKLCTALECKIEDLLVYHPADKK
ncbi:MAG: helix-turn-helix transcriptional regulator [Lachnospiraceae bacterium]|nr:helix-turn-helix transcriptional regulator [Lachnospiraceae bacterium]